MRNLTPLLSFLFVSSVYAQVYPPQKQLVFDAMPTVSKPAYLVSITDPTFKSTVIRISDQSEFNKTRNNLSVVHHYAKNQAWNSDGTLIKLHGWPAPILDGNTFKLLRTINPPGGHTTWANTQPNIIYGAGNDNKLRMLNISTNTTTEIASFSDFTHVSYGSWESNMSNDDRYIALQCSSASQKAILVYDIPNKKEVARMNAPVWPNNVGMSQSGKYMLVQWNVAGTAQYQGIWAFNTSDLSPVRNINSSKGGHFDYGYDTDGNEVVVGNTQTDRGLAMTRIDNGKKTELLGDNQMSWYIHVSCRNLNRPGWAYLTEFADVNTQKSKPNFQKIFAVKLDINANKNALTETYAHVHHSDYIDYEWSPFGTPNRDGSKVLFRSDWMGGGSAEVNSYVAYMQSPTENEETNYSKSLFIFPNPTTDKFYLNNLPPQSTIIISDLTGKILISVNAQNASETIDISSLEAGIYLVKVGEVIKKINVQ